MSGWTLDPAASYHYMCVWTIHSQPETLIFHVSETSTLIPYLLPMCTCPAFCFICPCSAAPAPATCSSVPPHISTPTSSMSVRCSSLLCMHMTHSLAYIYHNECRHGLRIGALFAWPVRLAMWVLSPIAWPLARALDLVLGHQDYQMMKRRQLKVRGFLDRLSAVCWSARCCSVCSLRQCKHHL